MTDDPATILLEFFEADSQKYFDEPAGTPLFDRPEVAVASADDPWFERFKDLIGGFYWTPGEALALADASARAQSVICWSLPVAQIARQANRRQTETPARQWAYNQFRDGRGLELFGWEGAYGCGLCQTAAPCEGRNPTEEN